MKLAKVTSNEKSERIPLNLRASVAKHVKLYRDFYKKVHGDEIAMSHMIEEMLKSFMGEDKAFQKFVQEAESKTK